MEIAEVHRGFKRSLGRTKVKTLVFDNEVNVKALPDNVLAFVEKKSEDGKTKTVIHTCELPKAVLEKWSPK